MDDVEILVNKLTNCVISKNEKYNRLKKIYLELCSEMDINENIKNKKNSFVGLEKGGILIKNFSYYNSGMEFLKQYPSEKLLEKEINRISIKTSG